MAEGDATGNEAAFSLALEHLQGYEFRLKFDWENVPDLVLDEPSPLGNQRGPNASRLLAASIASCLSASLLFCLNKSRIETRGMKTRVSGWYRRNPKGRLRVDRLEVAISVDADAARSPRLSRCMDLFEDYCVVTESVRQGIPVQVKVVDSVGALLLRD